MEAKELGTALKDAGVRWVDDGCYRLGAALAFFAIFSVFPLLLLSLTILGFFAGSDPSVRRALAESVADVTSGESRALLEETLAQLQTHGTARGVGAAVGLVTLIFGASGAFTELEFALNVVWRVKATPSRGSWVAVARTIRDKAVSLAAVLGAAVVVLASLVVSAALTSLGESTGGAPGVVLAWQTVEGIVSTGLLTGLFAAIFQLLPRTSVRWRDVFFGAFFTAILFAALKRLLAFYLAHAANYAAYGVVGAVLGFLTWIYAAALLLLYGAELSRVYAERFGSLAEAKERSAKVEQERGQIDAHRSDPHERTEPHSLP